MIIISPYARSLRNGDTNHPKNYPYWDELIKLLKERDDVVQVGSGYERILNGIEPSNFKLSLTLTELSDLVKSCNTWVSIDSFFQHFCWDLKKPGIALWGQSDPLIFGHTENINLLKSRSYLRENQFWQWEQTHYDPTAFVQPHEVISALDKLI